MKARVNLADGQNGNRHVGDPFGEVEITLSRRNLYDLVRKLEDGAESAIQKLSNGIALTVTVENDDEHYGDDSKGVVHAQ